jgi:hypothetical protein
MIQATCTFATDAGERAKEVAADAIREDLEHVQIKESHE